MAAGQADARSTLFDDFMKLGLSDDCNFIFQYNFDHDSCNANVCDKLRLTWTGDFPSLKSYMSEYLKVNGEWSQPGGDKKVFNSVDDGFSVSWRKNKKLLSFEGKNAKVIMRIFCLDMCMHLDNSESKNMNPTDMFENSSTNPSTVVDEASAIPITSTQISESTNDEGTSTQTKCNSKLSEYHKEPPKSFDETVGRSECACSRVCEKNSKELEDLQLNIEILQSRTDSLQSLANVQEVCFPAAEILKEIESLKQDLVSELKLITEKVFNSDNGENKDQPDKSCLIVDANEIYNKNNQKNRPNGTSSSVNSLQGTDISEQPETANVNESIYYARRQT